MRFLASFLAVLAVLGNLSLSALSCQMPPETYLGIEALGVVCSVGLEGGVAPAPVDHPDRSQDCCTTCFHLGHQPVGPRLATPALQPQGAVSQAPVLTPTQGHPVSGFSFAFPNKGSPAAI